MCLSMRLALLRFALVKICVAHSVAYCLDKRIEDKFDHLKIRHRYHLEKQDEAKARQKMGGFDNLNNKTIREAVKLYLIDKDACEEIYGPIVDWNTGGVTDMSHLFAGLLGYQKKEFNEVISLWDTSRVINMRCMFRDTVDFNGDISLWDVRNVNDMTDMFNFAEAFNQDISSWDTRRVIMMRGMFRFAHTFNQDISCWDTENVTNMSDMFYFAEAFNQDLSPWKFSKVDDMVRMFFHANSFNQDISTWGIDKDTNTLDMVVGTKFLNP